jgi:hypothetical protein
LQGKLHGDDLRPEIRQPVRRAVNASVHNP